MRVPVHSTRRASGVVSEWIWMRYRQDRAGSCNAAPTRTDSICVRSSKADLAASKATSHSATGSRYRVDRPILVTVSFAGSLWTLLDFRRERRRSIWACTSLLSVGLAALSVEPASAYVARANTGQTAIQLTSERAVSASKPGSTKTPVKKPATKSKSAKTAKVTKVAPKKAVNPAAPTSSTTTTTTTTTLAVTTTTLPTGAAASTTAPTGSTIAPAPTVPSTTIVPRLPTGPGASIPPEAVALLPPVPSVGTTILHRKLDPTANLPADLTPQEYVDVVLGWAEFLSVRRKAVDLAALRARVEAVTASATTTAQTYPALAAYLAMLGDGHSALYTPNEARSLLEGRAQGFGFSLIEGYVFPLPGSPAEQAGMRDRDRLVAVNGAPFVVGTTRLSSVPDTSVFQVARVDPVTSTETLVTVTATRGEITTSLKPKVRRLTDNVGTDTRIGVIDLPGSTGSRADETQFVQQGIDGIRETDAAPRCGWILDLRRNSGGFGTSMLAGVAPLYGDGTFAGFIDSQERVQWLSIKGSSVLIDGRVQVSAPSQVKLANPNAPIAVLTGPATASAAELAVVGLAGRGGVRTFGEPTVGVTSGNLGRSYPDGSFVAVTNVYDVDRLGRVYDGPLQPDEPVKTDWGKYGLAGDPVVAAATTWLKAQPACSVGG